MLTKVNNSLVCKRSPLRHSHLNLKIKLHFLSCDDVIFVDRCIKTRLKHKFIILLLLAAMDQMLPALSSVSLFICT